MQKLTILKWDFDKNTRKKSKVYKKAKYNLGQEVIIIDWKLGKPHLLQATVLGIGIVHPLQGDDFVYILDKLIKNDSLERFYENEIYPDRLQALKKINQILRSTLKIVKDAKTHPYYNLPPDI